MTTQASLECRICGQRMTRWASFGHFRAHRKAGELAELAQSPDALKAQEATDQFKAAMTEALLPSVRWLDRQMRRWPWLYRRLGGTQ